MSRVLNTRAESLNTRVANIECYKCAINQRQTHNDAKPTPIGSEIRYSANFNRKFQSCTIILHASLILASACA